MSASRDDAFRLRQADGDLTDRISQAPPRSNPGAASLVGQTTTVTTYPSTAASFYAILVTDLYGAETEGGVGSYTIRTRVVYALNIGSGVPPAGTKVILTHVPSRWVFRYDG